MTSMNDKSKLYKFKEFVSALIPAILVLMVVLSFTLSVVSISKVGRLQREVSSMSVEFAGAVKDLREVTSDMDMTMQAIEGHLAFLDKYMSDHWSFFYGNDRVSIDVDNRSKTKTTKK